MRRRALRDLAGRVDADGTVSLWAVTATTSGSGDNGADPNEIVQITDSLGATTLPTSEQFSVLDGPEYGLRYGGVACALPEPGTWGNAVGEHTGGVSFGREVRGRPEFLAPGCAKRRVLGRGVML
jgi:hypothetical protein